MVVNDGVSGEVGLNTEGSIELVGLSTGLRSDGVSSSLRSGASILGCLVSAAAVHEGVANELSDDVDVLSGTVVVRSWKGTLKIKSRREKVPIMLTFIDRLEARLLPSVETCPELDLGNRAAPEVTDRTGGRCGRRCAGGYICSAGNGQRNGIGAGGHVRIRDRHSNERLGGCA